MSSPVSPIAGPLELPAARLWPMPAYEVTASRTVYEGRFATVRVDEVRMPDETSATREVVEQTNAVAVVPVDAGNLIVMVRQYRHAVGEYLLELPAGKLDVEGEEPLAAAHRELAEEAGLQAGHYEELISFYNSAGWTTEKTTVYLARDLRDVPVPDGYTAEHEEADMQVLRLPLADLVAKIRAGEITDAKTIVGILLAFDKLGGAGGS